LPTINVETKGGTVALNEKCQDYHDQWCRHAAGAGLQEKGSIAATAQHIAGTNNVDNQLEIKGY